MRRIIAGESSTALNQTGNRAVRHDIFGQFVATREPPEQEAVGVTSGGNPREQQRFWPYPVALWEGRRWRPRAPGQFSIWRSPTQGWRTNNNQGLIGNQTETMRSASMTKHTSFRKNIVFLSTIVGSLSMLVFGPSAHARSEMVLYEGKSSVIKGRGGTKVTDHDIDFWTTGEPARRFRVLAKITDERGTGPFADNVDGAQSIAEKVKEAGGDAVIISRDVTGSRRIMDAFLSDRNTCSVNCAARVKPAITRMIVIKYLGS